MGIKKVLVNEIIRKGHSVVNGVKVWNLAERDLLYSTKDLASGFINLRKQPRYKKVVIDIENELIKKHADSLLKGISNESFNLIDLGCADGTKAEVFIESLKGRNKIRFCP